nr:hypothetical protein [Tanacetum cinerariifolium]
SVKRKTSKDVNWDNQDKHQSSGFTKYTNGFHRSVVKPEYSTSVSNLFSVLEEDNGKYMDNLVDNTRNKVEAPPRKTSIWSGRKAEYPKRTVAEETEHGNASIENGDGFL